MGIGAKKSMFFIKAWPCLPYQLHLQILAQLQAWPEQGLGSRRVWCSPRSSLIQRPTVSTHLSWGLFCGKLFPNFLQISKKPSALTFPWWFCEQTLITSLTSSRYLRSISPASREPLFQTSHSLRLGTPRSRIRVPSSQAPGLLERPPGANPTSAKS